MDKTAEIEKIKLHATFLNNVGVGLMLGGFLIPYLGIVQKAGTITEVLGQIYLDRTVLMNAIASLIAMFMAFWGARQARRYANETLDRLKTLEAPENLPAPTIDETKKAPPPVENESGAQV